MTFSVDFTTPGFDPASLPLLWSARADAEAEAAYAEYLRDMAEPVWGTYGEFEPFPDDTDWDAHNAEADAWFAQYDDDPNPYLGTYSEE